ncbi:ABC transporter ATP-binding protein [Polaribacter reichenbachii]|uniref:ABC transporter ATP-binding protein n=1 Tax=Polaribacter reichenbachii TaxID=996801 RepID=A0A1B8U460_9FLAO|nr:ATP-binding cassette domain-containing protein [Polaribacter reichenbachii]APZ47404.1 ABC transporter ATP-binding protein [Polaribacter reichenbachii]AUC18043.1 ABC transporter ATP-binding protein [Polaribacter reichenbachii]OBY66653.1 ABC transporter ATP-binding protein [Polaribacter reichenbachii]
MIKTKNLTFQYKNSEPIFRFPDIHLSAQENLLILGKSGVGKTTFLHLLAGLLKPVSGTITMDDNVINKLKNKELDGFRGANIGLVFQKKHAIQSLTVTENLKARILFSKKRITTDVIENLLTQLDLSAYKNKKIHVLSEGQLQRLGIALAAIHHPKVILADEPTSSLDDFNCKKVIELLLQQAQQTKAHLIVITHDARVKCYFQNTISL